MIILISSKITQSNIHASLGKAEYSYFFLLKDFLPALERIGKVIHVSSQSEVDDHYVQYSSQGQPVVFISVSPPHQTPLTSACPTVSLFAWEFDSLPSGGWDESPCNDWRYAFACIQGAISTSQETAALVTQVMGDAYPIIAMPAPIWDRYSRLGSVTGKTPILDERKFSFAGIVIDSCTLGLSADGLVRKQSTESVQDEDTQSSPERTPLLSLQNTVAHSLKHSAALLRGWWAEINSPIEGGELAVSLVPVTAQAGLPDEPHQAALPPLQEVLVNGVVYCTVLNPADSRKNWVEVITGFCWAFKNVEDATLVVKMTHYDLEYYRIVLITLLSRLAPFKCRVLVLHGYLEDREYQALIAASSFYVNASSGEGLCLPLMEFLSASKPVIAPAHTAMADYIDSEIAFLVECSLEPFCWPHDPTGIFHTHRHRLNWQSLMEAYKRSYQIAKADRDAYQRMSMRAYARMHSFASVEQTIEPLRNFLAGVIESGRERPNTLQKRGAAQ